MCYHEKISPYWSRLWAKAALLTGRQNMSEGQYFIHLACSLHHCERVFFWAVYNNTCALYFLQINGNARGATQDGCHGQVNLSTAEQRHTDQDRGDQPIYCDEPKLAPICCALLCLTKLFSPHYIVSFHRFIYYIFIHSILKCSIFLLY